MSERAARVLRPYRFFLAVILANLVLAAVKPSLAWASSMQTVAFLGSVLAVVPAVMVVMALFDVWVPREVVEANIGPGSGFRGMLTALLLGTAAAGPLYAAFPVARSLHGKGARLANIVVFLGAWATIKIPMVLLESSYLGLRFALLRLALTIPGILGVGVLMERVAGVDVLPLGTVNL